MAAKLAVTLEFDQTTLVVPADQVDALLVQLDRPAADPEEIDRTSVATVIRRARDRAPATAMMERSFAPALLAAIAAVERAAGGLEPETVALRAHICESFAAAGSPRSVSS